MFELIVSLCLASDMAICRDVLLPGYEAPSGSECGALLAGHPVDPASLFPGTVVSGAPQCLPAGRSAETGEIAEGVFVHRGRISDAAPENYGDVSNSGFVIGTQSVAVIDSG